MDTKDFKNIVGEANAGEVATIKFFGKVTEDSVRSFNYEFEWLENGVKPSEIVILINSEGGSVLHGMSLYATIQNSTIPTKCINEGLAASMGSVIWAAGDQSLMRDYAILMIHNPFVPSDQPKANEQSEIVKAFTKQIETIYRKRFGLSKAEIQSIMDGETGKDGTFFDADAAVKAGIIPKENVIKTSKQVCEKVKNEIDGINNATEIQDVMDRIACEVSVVDIQNKQSNLEDSNLNKNENPEREENKINTNKKMEDEKTIGFEIGAVAATLGFKSAFEVKDVMAKITTLMSVEASLVVVKKSLEDANTVIAGKDAAITNLQTELGTVQSALDVYKEKETADRNREIEAVVDTAIAEGKITKESKTQWVQMAGSNIELAKQTLASIPAREVITAQIATDKDNIQAAVEGTKTEAELAAEKVVAAVGKDFAFKKAN